MIYYSEKMTSAFCDVPTVDVNLLWCVKSWRHGFITVVCWLDLRTDVSQRWCSRSRQTKKLTSALSINWKVGISFLKIPKSWRQRLFKKMASAFSRGYGGCQLFELDDPLKKYADSVSGSGLVESGSEVLFLCLVDLCLVDKKYSRTFTSDV